MEDVNSDNFLEGNLEIAVKAKNKKYNDGEQVSTLMALIKGINVLSSHWQVRDRYV